MQDGAWSAMKPTIPPDGYQHTLATRRRSRNLPGLDAAPRGENRAS